VTALEIIREAELEHPRIDVVMQVTSVYRDQFDVVMRNFAAGIEALAALPEGESPVAANVAGVRATLMSKGVEAAAADRLAAIRIFSNPPGDYGSGVTQAAMDSTSWEDDSYLAETYFNSQSFAYGTGDWGTPVREMALFETQLEGVEAAIFSRSTNLHGLVSTDHPFEYLGGLSSAVRAVNGESPSLYVTDLRSKEPKMAKASEFLSTELRARYQNPQWIGAMKAEGYAGTVNMLKVVNNLFGWQVMDRSMVREDQWQAMHETYVMDARDMDLNAWFEANNPTAQAQIIERMTEAIRKGYWAASEQNRRELVERWQTLTNELGADKGADTTVAFLEEMAAGFGMSAGAAPAEAGNTPDAAPASEQAQPVRGQVMQQVPDEGGQPRPTPFLRWIMWLLLSFAFMGGIARSFTDYNKALRPTRTE
jgi:cobaltochelatase CobN